MFQIRRCIGLIDLNRVTTLVITQIPDRLIEFHGKPREILTDNGDVFWLRSKHSRFDRWCRKRGIKHIRTAIHSPTTTGKLERFFQTSEWGIIILDHTLVYTENLLSVYFGG